MTREEAIKMAKADLKCMERDTSGQDEMCNSHKCDECSLNYERGNIGEQKEWLRLAIKALEQEPMEKFENVKDHIFKLAGDYKCWDNRLTDDEALELCHILEQEPSRDMEEIEEVINCDADAETKCKMISNILTAKPHYFEKQESFKPMVEIDLDYVIKQKYIEREALDKIRAEIEKQEKWLLQAGYNTYNVDIAFNSIKRALTESEGEE